ncbi:endonuclease/exonuclease/phosphatase family protein [Subtercola sp. PAMC28395]|uniref:endonuclease/exonuclease/phosphatase family protein n=1 Tax=Subtercola sp. PAMC28395 TaxID=2846775 RepID=UPI001C0BD328|nr:endonuclease/exonuclease/phosphatase family protein [Subtercola sp. PAMC28395]QWT22872.1 endonuclease/exonuclease/phosphatase family protein [Subtercola sp. PAMC28395]
MSFLSTPTRPVPVSTPEGHAVVPRRGSSTLGITTVILALLLVGLLLFHTAVPDIAGVGLVLDTAIPWFGLLVLPLGVLALISRRRRAWLAVLAPIAAWALLFGPSIVPLSWGAVPPSTAEGTSLTVASQNIEATSGTGAQSATALAATGADVIALEEMTSTDFDTISATLASAYPYSYGVGTVGLWSKYPVLNAQPLNLGLGWNRALAADLQTPQGLVSIYVIHAASARPGDVSARDSMLSALATTLPRDENNRVIAVGDFNAASTDRAMAGIESQLTESNQSEGMFGSTWPTPLPLTRLDHLLQRGMTVTSNTTLRAGDSDHRAILTSMNL